MRAALWLVALFAVAVAIALFAGNNQAAVTLFWPPYRVDLSLNLSLLLAVGLFVLIHLALRGLAAVFSLPVQARRWQAASCAPRAPPKARWCKNKGWTCW